MMRRKDRAEPDSPEPAEETGAPGVAADAPATADGPAGVQEAKSPLEIEIEQLRAREDELLRALAELQNVSRRRRQEMDQSIAFAQEGLIRDLLPVLDDLDRALSATDSRPDDPVRAGLLLIQDRLFRTLAKEGLEALRPLGNRFDPELMDALAQREVPDALPETVLEVALPGYKLKGRVLRHAQVVVASSPSGAP